MAFVSSAFYGGPSQKKRVSRSSILGKVPGGSLSAWNATCSLSPVAYAIVTAKVNRPYVVTNKFRQQSILLTAGKIGFKPYEDHASQYFANVNAYLLKLRETEALELDREIVNDIRKSS